MVSCRRFVCNISPSIHHFHASERKAPYMYSHMSRPPECPHDALVSDLIHMPSPTPTGGAWHEERPQRHGAAFDDSDRRRLVQRVTLYRSCDCCYSSAELYFVCPVHKEVVTDKWKSLRQKEPTVIKTAVLPASFLRYLLLEHRNTISCRPTATLLVT